jgi:nucleoside-diphosphate-sugar epimerase
MKLFITGGGGFLGKAIVQQLSCDDHDLVTYSRKIYLEFNQLRVHQKKGCITDYDTLKKAMKGCEAVFHVAAKTGTWGKKEDFYRTNVEGTKNVIKACRELKIRHLIFTSSASVVYRGKNSEGHDESLPYPKKYNAYYPETKAISEQFVLAANDDQLKTVCIRPHLIWGPNDPHFLPRLIERSKKGKLRALGQSPHLVDCTYIENAARAHVLALQQLVRDSAKVEGKTYFISQDEPIPVNEFINKMLASAGCEPVTKHLSPKVAYLAGWLLEKLHRALGISAEPLITPFLAQQLSTAHWYDISAAKKDFNYRIEVSIKQGMERLKKSLSTTSIQ